MAIAPQVHPNHGEVAHAIMLFFVQLAVVVILMVGLVPAFATVMSPLQSFAIERWGPNAAVWVVASANVISIHLVGALLTLPALVGLKFGKIQVTKTMRMSQLMRDLPLVGLNALIGVAWGAALTFLTASDVFMQNLSLGLPSSWVVVQQSAFFLLTTEAWFYHVHRLFHENKLLYAKVHKVHHTWKSPVALVTTYTHPAEHILVNLLSISLGPLLLGSHPTTALAFTWLFSVGAMGHHSGYWSDDLGMHDLHHESFNVNYGNAHILDCIYGTYRTKSTAQRRKIAD